MFDEPDRMTPDLVIAVVLLGFASLVHVGTGIFLSFFTAGMGESLERLAPPFQLVFGVIAAVAAYRIWEGEASGLAIALSLGVAGIGITAVVGFGLPLFLKGACLVPAFLELAGGIAASVGGREG